MRNFAVFALSALVVGFYGSALAADEFGERFSEQTPSAFEDPVTDPEKALSEIMPAAGEETVTEEEFEDGASNTDAPIVDTPSTTESETIQE